MSRGDSKWFPRPASGTAAEAAEAEAGNVDGRVKFWGLINSTLGWRWTPSLEDSRHLPVRWMKYSNPLPVGGREREEGGGLEEILRILERDAWEMGGAGFG